MIIDELLLLLNEIQLRAFLACYAGTDVRFEKTNDGPSFARLTRVIGYEAAVRVRRHFAGERVYIPRSVAEERARRDAEIRDRVAAGESVAAVARSYRTVTTLTERHVRRIAAAGNPRKTEPDETARPTPVAVSTTKR